MILRTALCLALALGAASARTRPTPLTAPKGDPTVPAPGSIGERVEKGRGRALGAFRVPRTDFQASVLPDGRVLITGGSSTSPTSEWYQPATHDFAPGPALTCPRQGHRALTLRDGRILVLGGTEAPAPAEVLDAGAPAFRPLPGGTFALSTDTVELEDGRVVLVDGASGRIYVWDGKSSLSSRGTLAVPRNFFRAVGLKDGRVAITGGWPLEQRVRGRRITVAPDLPVECFNPRWSTLSAWSQRPRPRARHQATLLADGRICLWGGVGQDPDRTVDDVDLLDPVQETVSPGAPLDLQGNPCPAWARDGAGRGIYLPERGQTLLGCATPLELAGAATVGRLANGYLNPTLVPLPDGSVLVLGTAAFGDPLDRWDPRTRQTAVVGTLRAGCRSLGLLPDGTVLALGVVVDRLDPRTGTLTPLGWREDLEALLRKVKPLKSKPYGLKLKDGSVLVEGAGKE